MPYNFEEFTGRWKTVGTGPRATIQRRGSMSFNRAAREALGSPTHVVLLFDSQARVIGVKAATPELKHAYPLRRQQAADSYLISAVTFLDRWGIPHDRLMAFDEVEVEDGILILRLESARQGDLQNAGRHRERVNA